MRSLGCVPNDGFLFAPAKDRHLFGLFVVNPKGDQCEGYVDRLTEGVLAGRGSVELDPSSAWPQEVPHAGPSVYRSSPRRWRLGDSAILVT